jgi:hypothetical protein
LAAADIDFETAKIFGPLRLASLEMTGRQVRMDFCYGHLQDRTVVKPCP